MTEVIQAAERSRYELAVDGQVAFANYRLEDDTLYITHVEAPPALRGTGAAGRLMQGMMQQIAKANEYKVVPICGYAAAWLKKHSEFHPLLKA